MNLISAKDAAEKWEISQRRVAILCNENRIPGAQRIGNMWVIPANADKPTDGRRLRYEKTQLSELKPFIKWAGGKGQLLPLIRKALPAEFGKGIKRYAEPFVGGGAVLFDILPSYNLDAVFICDINAELINTYRIVRDKVEELIELLLQYEIEYHPMDEFQRKEYYYAKRERFNELKVNGDSINNLESASNFIFLNRTCYNGLYRVNRKGLFNVPIGSYKMPTICDAENLRNISTLIQKVDIVCGDYRKSSDFIDSNTFVYFDPPYRPLSATSTFTSYMEGRFGDKEQCELAEYARILSSRGAKVLLSNSDPKNVNLNDNFFDEIYSDFQIDRVGASRMINSKAKSRGKINELLIRNY